MGGEAKIWLHVLGLLKRMWPSQKMQDIGSGNVQIQSGGGVHVHITLAQQELDADALITEAIRQALPQSRAVADPLPRRRLTPSQRELLLSIRNLPIDKEQAVFAFMAKHLGTKMVGDLDELAQRRLSGYLDSAWNTVHEERRSGRRVS